MRLLSAVALCILLTGCLGASNDAGDDTQPDAPAREADAPALLAALSLPVRPDAARIIDDLEAFVDMAPRRYDNMFEHDLARDWLEAAYLDAGLNVSRHTFSGPAQGLPGTIEGVNIIATLPGQDPNRIILFGGHYDSAVTGYGGAYDDGGGTLITLALARALSSYEWDHTLIFAAWDQEEAGLVGSRAWVADLLETDTTITLAVNFDMTGINWPAKVGGVRDVDLRVAFGGEMESEHAQAWEEVAQFLGWPSIATSTSTGLGSGASDHGSFREGDYPAAWARGALIGEYPAYHNGDTFQSMVAMVGGDRTDLVAGFDTVLQGMFLFAFILDASQ